MKPPPTGGGVVVSEGVEVAVGEQGQLLRVWVQGGVEFPAVVSVGLVAVGCLELIEQCVDDLDHFGGGFVGQGPVRNEGWVTASPGGPASAQLGGARGVGVGEDLEVELLIEHR